MKVLSGSQALHEMDPEETVDESEPEMGLHELFRYEDYDWTASGFTPNYRVIRLGAKSESTRPCSPYKGVFFTVVSIARFELPEVGATTWYPLVERMRDKHGQYLDTIKRVGAHRKVYAPGASKAAYLHRVITNTEDSTILVDHKGLGPLDNRDEALHVADYSINSFTARRAEIHRELPKGVEWRDRARTIVGGVVGLDRVKIRSEQTWPHAQRMLAHAWYKAKRDELMRERTKKTTWVNWKGTIPPLIFPPRKKIFYSVSLPTFDGEIPF